MCARRRNARHSDTTVEILRPIQRVVRPLAQPIGVAVGDETPLKNWLNQIVAPFHGHAVHPIRIYPRRLGHRAVLTWCQHIFQSRFRFRHHRVDRLVYHLRGGVHS